MLRGRRGHEGTHSPRRDAGNEGTQPTRINQPETMDFVQVTWQYNSPESSRPDSKRSAESAFGSEGVDERPGSLKHARVEAATFASWERAKIELIQQQMAETQSLKDQGVRDYKAEIAMTRRHNEQLKELWAKKPAETLLENDPPTGSGIMGDIERVQAMRRRETSQ